jgi:hypothetical protein
MARIIEMTDRVLSDINNEGLRKNVKEEVQEFCSGFPLYPEILAGAGPRPEAPAEAVA